MSYNNLADLTIILKKKKYTSTKQKIYCHLCNFPKTGAALGVDIELLASEVRKVTWKMSNIRTRWSDLCYITLFPGPQASEESNLHLLGEANKKESAG